MRYDRIGKTYSLARRTEPRIAVRIHDALGDARRVLNVGAGTGSYEPTDRDVIAVEPSATMLAQRAPGAAPAVRAIAERAAALDPSLATTAFIKEDREGKVFVDSTRVGGATVVAAYSPRVRPGVPVSFPLAWDQLDDVTPSDFTIHTALDALGDRDPWAEHMPDDQHLTAELVAEGHELPVARVQAMHEGKRRKRARDPRQ